MPHNAVLGTQQLTDKQIIDRVHPAIIRGKAFRQDGRELAAGSVVAKDLNGDLAAYVPALADAGSWEASTAVVAGELKLPTTGNDHYYICVTGGTTDSSEPTWPTTTDGEVADGTVVWAEAGLIGVETLAGGGVLTEMINTAEEEVGAVMVHGAVAATNVNVAGAALSADDVEALDAVGIYAI